MSASRQERRPAGKWRVLAVEDDESNQEVLECMLEFLGYEVAVAANGREAVEALEEPDAFDIVLMDCEMPVMDGYDAVRRIRKREQERGLPRIPIIATTAHAMARDYARGRAAGMDEILTKPIELDALGRALSRWTSEGTTSADAFAAAPAPRPPRSQVLDDEVVEGLRGLEVPERPQFFSELVEKYRRNAVELAEGIRQAVSDRDLGMAATFAHTLEGSSRAVGARGVRLVATDIEVAASRGELDACAAALADLVAELERAVDSLNVAIGTPRDRGP